MNESAKEILRAAGENPGGEYERDRIKNGLNVSVIICIIMCLAMMIIEYAVSRRIDFGKPIIIAVLAGTMNFVVWRLEKRIGLLIRFIIDAVLFTAFLLFYIVQVIA